MAKHFKAKTKKSIILIRNISLHCALHWHLMPGGQTESILALEGA